MLHRLHICLIQPGNAKTCIYAFFIPGKRLLITPFPTQQQLADALQHFNLRSMPVSLLKHFQQQR